MPLPFPPDPEGCPPILRALGAARRAPARLLRAAAAQRDAAAQAAAAEPVRWTSLADSYAPPPVPKPRPRVPQAAPHQPATPAGGCERPVAPVSPAEAADPSDAGLHQAPRIGIDPATRPGLPHGASFDRLADIRAARPGRRPGPDIGDDEEGVLRSNVEVGDAAEVTSSSIGNISTIAASGGIGLCAAAILSASGLGPLATGSGGTTRPAQTSAPVSGISPSGGEGSLGGAVLQVMPSEPASVPEPASMLLLAGGLALLFLLRRQRG